MRKSRILTMAAVSLTVAGLAITATPGAALASDSVTRCTGELAPGTYHRIVVPRGATCFSEGPIVVRDGVRIRQGGSFGLSSEESGTDGGTIKNGIWAHHPAQVDVHFATIRGGVHIRGGVGPFGGSEGIFFSTIEDSTISGGAAIQGYDGFWLGFIRNTVEGNVRLSHNVSTEDPDSNEFVTNTIRGNLTCVGNSPAPQIGDSAGEENVVSGHKRQQCADLA